ncbi:hypothetical protein BjapCC829_46055 (plasmid) [Bradyrhizobium barranii]|uniref:Uncharacterized protein n=1 Tax=Bradyrhizobium barranii TaxID=2992140 RepID=A0ABY3R0K0_9BRAD|nr:MULTISPECIES: hypothetical protein [Bradyrhizobium]UFW91803.1 hypothetical protein BjapCC829_46055 [Bradyrhizobium japonicum]WFU00327.1 hypothetical protein QA633_46815 [Bradyrhizobium barranii]CUT16685.1 FIG01006414 hypothetical protein CDS [Bradyrhizobium sp.]
MKLLTLSLASAFLLACACDSHAVVRIANDRGGLIQRYLDRYDELKGTGQTVVIDGLCASACTIVLAKIPSDRVCVTERANLAFHAAWDLGAGGRHITNREATRMIFSMYPAPVRSWISARGGLSPNTIFLRGAQLQTIFARCYLDAAVFLRL